MPWRTMNLLAVSTIAAPRAARARVRALADHCKMRRGEGKRKAENSPQRHKDHKGAQRKAPRSGRVSHRARAGSPDPGRNGRLEVSSSKTLEIFGRPGGGVGRPPTARPRIDTCWLPLPRVTRP